MSICILNIGRPRTGKTTVTKNLLEKICEQGRMNDIIIYDVNDEYREFYNRPFVTYDEFIKKFERSKNKPIIKNKIIVFEEATIFFSNRSEEQILKELLVTKRHTKNTIILNFHSIRSIPRYVCDLTNYIILFKTNDTEDIVKQKIDNPKFLEVFKEVNSNPDNHFNRTFNMY